MRYAPYFDEERQAVVWVRDCDAEGEPVDRAATERRIVGALRSCIDAHGPITKEWLGSAAKRVASALDSDSEKGAIG